MDTVGYDRQNGDHVDEDDLDDCVPCAGLDVDRSGAANCLQPVHGNPSHAQCWDVDGDSLETLHIFVI